LNDGGEVDLDLGNYERYLDVTLSRDNNITTGKIYQQVIEKEVSANLRSCLVTPFEFTSLTLNRDVETILGKLFRSV
jgi:hypothetical protein